MKEAVNSGLMYEIFGTYHAPVPEYPIPECLLTNVRDKTNTAILVLGRNAGGEECDRRLEGDYYLTEEEKKLVSQVCENFPEVIVILNVNGLIDLEWTTKYTSVKSILFLVLPERVVQRLLQKSLKVMFPLPESWLIIATPV